MKLLQLKPKLAAVFLYRQKVEFYFKNGKQPITLTIPESALSDLEVKNKKELEELIKAFITDNKIVETEFVLLLTDEVSLLKDISIETSTDFSKEKSEFLESVPFEYFRYRTYQFPKLSRIIAVNRDFYETLIAIFEQLGLSILSVSPLSALSFWATGIAVDSKLVRVIFKKVVLLKQNDLLFEEKASTFRPQQENFWVKNKRLVGMLGVFGLLLALLGVVLVAQFKPTAQKVVTVTAEIPAVQLPPPSGKLPATLVASPSAEFLATLSAQVLNGSHVAGQADAVKKQLLDIGVKNVETGNSAVTNTNRTLVIYQKSLPQTVLEKILEAVGKVTAKPSAQQTDSASFDIVITTGSAK